MSNSSNLPVGAEFDSSAPYNEKSQPYKEVEVTISLSLSKTVKVWVNDYKTYAETDEEGNNCIYDDFSECDLKKAVQEQICLPNEAYDKLINAVLSTENYEAHEAIKDLKNWDTDDFEVMLE